MKKFLYLLLLLPNILLAETTVSLGGLTIHHAAFENQRQFSKCIGDCQAILNPILDIGLNQHHIFAGANSIARPMVGYRYNFEINSFTNFTVGGYHQDTFLYKKKGIQFPIEGNVIPLVGIDMNYKNIGTIITYPVTVIYYRF